MRPTALRPKKGAIANRDVLEKRRNDAQIVAALKNFETAGRYFQKGNFERAREIFEKLVDSAPHDVADRARIHLRACEQRLGRSAPAPKTAADYYDLGIAALNARNLGSAVELLNKADKLEPNKDYVRYALAAAHALQSNTEAALEHLKAAITLRSESRFQARQDEDFQSLASDPRFRNLLRAGGL